jgi:hypothetical protein
MLQPGPFLLDVGVFRERINLVTAKAFPLEGEIACITLCHGRDFARGWRRKHRVFA